MKMKKMAFLILRNNSLFIKMFLIMMLSIVAVSLLITFSSIRMSSNLFMETFSISNTKALEQIEIRFEDYSFAIVNATNEVQNNGTIKKVLTQENTNAIETSKSYHDISRQMERIYPTVESYDTNMIVLGNNERLYNMNYSNWPVSWDVLRNHPITKYTINRPNTLLYQFMPSTSFNDKPMIVATKALMERSTGEIYGVLYFPILEEQWKGLYEGYTSTENEVLLVNRAGQIVSSNKEEMIGDKADELLALAEKVEDEGLEFKDVTISGTDYMLMSQYLPTYDMYLVNLVDKDAVLANLINTKEILLISLGIVLLAVIVVFLISRRITNSISRLVKQISTSGKHDFTKPIDETGGYEAKKIANAFNSMLNELQEYVGLVVQAQQKQRSAELMALQHQINPHFLYNTLASIKFMIQQGKKEKATDMIHALISLLQNALSNVDQTITVEQEIKDLKNYVLINQARYGEGIKVNFFISPDCLDYQLPKLILQPFIENAFFHAFNIQKEGFVQILVSEKGGNLLCEIVDNGDGMEIKGDHTKEDIKEKRHLFSGIGIRNVHERIQMLYGEEFGVEITSEIGNGTKVKVELPLQISAKPKEITSI
ncbi:sensor histidine kinase [Microbacterium sp. APC 3898]|uniref:Sensor histidine kinase n=1 Tax=Planococcus notacanthi TaxID=3035188 RepID=A0ABT7ZN42_9BACL|nr:MULTISPECIES: sensor histidine kinase [Terrabacteria group]MDN3428561.1 sensor histidine kinase [Planococcus sp. APC 4016]MDN3498731.1 sensor histidine kinase [Microbacterium sp. APC 3898]